MSFPPHTTLPEAWGNATHLIHYKGKLAKSTKTAWKAALRRASITRRIRPYDLRHAFATEALAGGADIGSVAGIMAMPIKP